MKQKTKSLFRLGLAASAGLFIVNTMGFVDTVTGSALGCGKQWPLCNGQFIPDVWNRATTIEYTHRVVAFTVITLLVLFSVLAWRKYHRKKEVRLLIGTSVFAVLTEAGLGASSVFFNNPPWILAFHMGFAFTSFASCVLLAFTVKRYEKQGEREGTQRWKGITLPGFAKWAWLTMAAVFCAIYYGAFVSHSGYGSLFRGWPFPLESLNQAGFGLWLDIGHRLVALGLLLLILALVRKTYRFRWARRDLFTGSLCALVFTVLQMFSGAWLIFTNISIPAFLSHVSLASLLFVSVAYVAFQSLPRSRTAKAGTNHSMHGDDDHTFSWFKKGLSEK